MIRSGPPVIIRPRESPKKPGRPYPPPARLDRPGGLLPGARWSSCCCRQLRASAGRTAASSRSRTSALYLRSGSFLANYARSLGGDLPLDRLALALDGGAHDRALPGPGQLSRSPTTSRDRWRRARWKGLLLGLVVVPVLDQLPDPHLRLDVHPAHRGAAQPACCWGAASLAHPLELLYTRLAVLIGLVYGELPFMILPLYASLEKLDRSLLEAAADLGAARRAGLPAGDAAAHPAGDRRRASCSSSCPASGSSSSRTSWAARAACCSAT